MVIDPAIQEGAVIGDRRGIGDGSVDGAVAELQRSRVDGGCTGVGVGAEKCGDRGSIFRQRSTRNTGAKAVDDIGNGMVGERGGNGADASIDPHVVLCYRNVSAAEIVGVIELDRVTGPEVGRGLGGFSDPVVRTGVVASGGSFPNVIANSRPHDALAGDVDRDVAAIDLRRPCDLPTAKPRQVGREIRGAANKAAETHKVDESVRQWVGHSQNHLAIGRSGGQGARNHERRGDVAVEIDGGVTVESQRSHGQRSRAPVAVGDDRGGIVSNCDRAQSASAVQGAT